MRARKLLSLLLPVVLACSEDTPTPTDTKPSFASGCVEDPTVTAEPPTATQPPNKTGAVANFLVTNNCSVSAAFKMTASKSGQVTSVSLPNPSQPTIGATKSQTVFVTYNTGAAGSGQVTLTAALSTNLSISSFGSLSVSVSSGSAGIPFGPFDLFKNSTTLRQHAPFNLTIDFTDVSTILGTISLARQNHIRLVTQMTGGSHSNYLTNGKFDFSKWKARLNTLNTQTIRDSVARGVADGTILFNELMDEPDHPSWGGVMTHALLDSMSRYEKGIFPTLKSAVTVQWDWEKTKVYQSVDMLMSQYGFHQDTIVQRYRDSAVASAKRQNVGLMFSMNILDGGGKTFGTPMSAAQVQNFGNVLVAEPFACGLTMWTWDSAFMANPANNNAFNSIASAAAARPIKACSK
jgi:hypothetical protein